MKIKNNRKYLKWSLLVLVLISGLIAAYYMAVHTHEEVKSIAIKTSSLADTLLWFRWAAIVAIAAFWSQLINVIALYKSLDDTHIASLIQFRWRLIAYLVAFELLVVEGVLSKLL